MYTKIRLLFSFIFALQYSYAQIGHSLNFDGQDDHVIVPNVSFCMNTDYTIEGWFQCTNNNQVLQVLVDARDINTPQYSYIHVEIQRNGKLRFLHRVPSAMTGGTDVFSSSVVNDGAWHHFAAVKDTDSKLRLYVDGNLEVTSNITVLEIPEIVLLQLSRNYNEPRYYQGNMDDFRFWSSAKTHSEILANMNNELYGNEPNLDIYYTFNQGIPNGNNGSGCSSNTSPCVKSLIDFTGGGNSGTLYNFALNGTSSNWVSVSALPVELTKFIATLQEDKVLVHWQTASETNNKGFELQKSTNGTEWEYLGFFNGVGHTTDFTEYVYWDVNPEKGINYYRLKQYNYDNSYQYSDILAIEFSAKENTRIFPNPANTEINISGIEQGEIIIFDKLGHIVSKTSYIGSAIDLTTLASGFYQVQISTSKSTSIHKLIKA